ncbi:F510_1955 family glycosylhydrolase [Actinomadura sp. SCN-SB]|uniref:F510_1955 family glycosylhydrolase n=1 Tax=Actinomadura sp. SCN-SB TaxID=3373092 RepID=UPI0037522098
MVALAIALTACGGDPPPRTPGAADPGTGHVHGVGVDPSDGAVYIAAHYGVFKIVNAARADRVAGRVQDTMGFTIVGPKTFLASGHPSAADIGPGVSPHLGLIRSTDAGRTWSSVSEAGKADFHSLQPAGDYLYAYDSQTAKVRFSRDGGRTWTLGAGMELIDLAAHKDRPEKVYATTPQGLQVSDDSAAAFKPVAGAPLLTHVDSPTAGTLLGVTPDGRILASRSAGGWERRGQVPGGQATAFTAVDERRLLAVIEDGTVHQSRDGGRTFSAVYRNG